MSDEPKVETPGLGSEDEKESRPVEAIAATVRARWEREAAAKTPSGREPFSLERLTARRLSRSRLANGRVQQFAAEQVNICELMAFVICAEQPARAPKVVAILDDLAARRKRAEHIALQIEAAERASVQLWRIRLGSDQP